MPRPGRSASIGFQVAFGFAEYNDARKDHGQPSIGLVEYARTGHLWEATFENWESEFFQMGLCKSSLHAGPWHFVHEAGGRRGTGACKLRGSRKQRRRRRTWRRDEPESLEVPCCRRRQKEDAVELAGHRRLQSIADEQAPQAVLTALLRDDDRSQQARCSVALQPGDAHELARLLGDDESSGKLLLDSVGR